MTIEFTLPEIAEGVESADVAELHVGEGDVIDANQVVMELETEKAALELPCPHAGRVAKVHVAAGQKVPIGAVLLTIEESAEAPSAPQRPSAGAPQKTAGRAASAKAAEPARAEPAARQTVARAGEPPLAPPAAAVGAAQPAGVPTSAAAPPVRAPAPPAGEVPPPPPAGPATRRLARQLGVDLHRVSGSGPGGRITEEDVKQYVRSRLSAAVTAGPAPTGMQVVSLPDFSRFGPIQQQPLNKIARTSAQNLSTAWHAVPHVTQHDLVDITELEAARKRLLEWPGYTGPKVTLTAIMIKAAIAALKAFPHFNASLDPNNGTLILKQYYHIGVAVDTEYGLLVPVIRDADKKSILQLASELADVAQRARQRKLDLAEMQGGTFTITNLGGIGGTAFTPIVNYPEVAILGISRTQMQLRIIDGQLRERQVLPLSLSYDHRVINGADAARFVVKLGQTLTDHFQLLVET